MDEKIYRVFSIDYRIPHLNVETVASIEAEDEDEAIQKFESSYDGEIVSIEKAFDIDLSVFDPFDVEFEYIDV